MEWVNEFLSSPSSTVALGSGLVTLAGSTYLAYKNDFGAQGCTSEELENYLEETDTGITSPVSSWKAHEYNKELQERDEENQKLANLDYDEDNALLVRYADD